MIVVYNYIEIVVKMPGSKFSSRGRARARQVKALELNISMKINASKSKAKRVITAFGINIPMLSFLP